MIREGWIINTSLTDRLNAQRDKLSTIAELFNLPVVCLKSHFLSLSFSIDKMLALSWFSSNFDKSVVATDNTNFPTKCLETVLLLFRERSDIRVANQPVVSQDRSTWTSTDTGNQLVSQCNFSRLLYDVGVVLLYFVLHVSKPQQWKLDFYVKIASQQLPLVSFQISTFETKHVSKLKKKDSSSGFLRPTWPLTLLWFRSPVNEDMSFGTHLWFRQIRWQ